jgi:branched-chain amino acid transport system permease protein
LGFAALNGLVWGCIIALMALGLNLIYGILRVINLAHGALYMLGAVIAWSFAPFISFWGTLILVPLLVGAFGAFFERTVLRSVEGRPTMTIVATFALMLLLQQAALMLFGSGQQQIDDPLGWSFPLFGLNYPGYRLFVAILSIVAMAGLWIFLQKTRVGLWVRAISSDPELAAGLGIPLPAVYGLAFGLGSFLAALAGVLAAPITSVDYLMGFDVLILAFIVVIIGGTGSLIGSLIVAIGMSEVENLLPFLAQPFLGQPLQPTLARALTLALLVVLLLLRPQGLFHKQAAA